MTLALALLVTGCAAGLPDAAIGLVKGPIDAIPVPPPVADETSLPGEGPAPPRSGPGAPPVIPHGVADLLPITRAANPCVDCHGITEKQAGMPTPIPGSHYVDLRNAPAAERPEIAGARFVCTACHVPRTAAAPLVGMRP